MPPVEFYDGRIERPVGGYGMQDETAGCGSSTMRVCMIAFGAVEYAVALAYALTKSCTVDFFASAHHVSRKDPSILEVLGGRARVILFGRHRHRDVRNLLVYTRLCRDIRRRQYDVVHFQGPAPPWAVITWKLFCRNVPLVITVHDPRQHIGLPVSQRVLWDVMTRVWVKEAGCVIVHGDGLKADLLEVSPMTAPENVHVLPHGHFGVYYQWEPDTALQQTQEKTVLFFGGVRPNKGLEYLLRAEPIIRATVPEARLVVAGRCSEWNRYKPFIDANARISVVNRFIPSSEVPAYFQQASVVVLPYLSATQSGVAPLAFTFGKPVVATQVGALPEIVRHGETGLLVEPGNAEALAEAVIRILQDERMAERLGRTAKRYAQEELSWDSIAEGTVKVYRQVLAVKRRHGL